MPDGRRRRLRPGAARTGHSPQLVRAAPGCPRPGGRAGPPTMHLRRLRRHRSRPTPTGSPATPSSTPPDARRTATARRYRRGPSRTATMMRRSALVSTVTVHASLRIAPPVRTTHRQHTIRTQMRTGIPSCWCITASAPAGDAGGLARGRRARPGRAGETRTKSLQMPRNAAVNGRKVVTPRSGGWARPRARPRVRGTIRLATGRGGGR